jgi:DNA primase catalytic subunit
MGSDLIIFGSRALNLSKKRRKQIADYLRWVRSLRQYVGRGQTIEQRKHNEREVLIAMLAQGEPEEKPPTATGFNGRIERSDEDRYYDRVCAREAQTQRALRDLDAIKARGPW